MPYRRYFFRGNCCSCQSGSLHSMRKKTGKLRKNEEHELLLDVATGTADFAIAASALHPGKIEGVDIAEKMLDAGRKKIIKLGLENMISLSKADSENLPFADNTF